MKQPLLFNYCDQKQQIFNIIKNEVKHKNSFTGSEEILRSASYRERAAGIVRTVSAGDTRAFCPA
ncbi:hypothetical protein HPG81_14295 [Salmonella enterica subsp. VII serovar 1,40:g,z51:--]|nr:hypothetical protein [Salmonella enterica subsp. VII str. CFSAN000550]EDT6884655.1 hypothetical protein [Salmonella enterica subsp. enterica]EDU7901694.1 hypothetical protein [Salmonella enterica subsp. houtenae]EEO7411941.1 hypothetical protein [Salmonella enterica]QJY67548.1 hypothetical protein HPG81_14295 [Salmonella enterica subsp. VII serovar 1,40:g,z51:--]